MTVDTPLPAAEPAREPTELDRVRPCVLIVDDDRALCHLLTTWLERDGYSVETFHDGQSALSGLGHLLPEACCLDLNMPGLTGLHTLEQIKSYQPSLPVLILTADTNVDTIVQAMKLGAYDYLAKPIQRVELSNRLRHAVESYRMSLKLAQLEREVSGTGFSGIVGSSAPMCALYNQMDRLSSSDITVLIHGESGTGKELVAQALHRQSPRRTGPFVPVNCAAIPQTLQESELFGHEKGAFTGAATQRIGRFEQAHRGTLFLDEVAELAPEAQAKLLRVLQERRFTRVGGSKEISSDFRLIAATHRDLGKRVRDGDFRDDLYYRIAVFEIEVPPLRDRADDIPELVEFFQADFAVREQRAALGIAPSALSLLQRYHWPGNVRELQNAVQRATVASDGKPVQRRHLPPRILQALVEGSREVTFRSGPELNQTPRLAQAGIPSVTSIDDEDDDTERSYGGLRPPQQPETSAEQVSPDPIMSLEQVEKRAIIDAIEKLDGNLSRVGRQLGIGRTTLYRKLEKYGLR